MRRTLLLCAILAIGCSKSDQPPADSAQVQNTAPPAISLADVAGTWEGSVMTETSDSVIAVQMLTATADPMTWTMTVANAKTPTKTVAVPVTGVVAAGDSIVIQSGPFDSVLRPGQKVSIHSITRLQDGKLVMVIHATYVANNEMIPLRGTATRKMAP